MTLPKAIEILSDSAYRGITYFDRDFRNAQKLLIEAGKVLIHGRLIGAHHDPAILPGETKE